MRFTPDFVQQLRDRIPLSSLIGRHVRLQRKGREWAGCCPFHKEKTPSFYVQDDKQFYHCFGCGAHGDVVKFLMQHEGLGFPESCEQLAGMAGIALPDRDFQTREPSFKDDYALLETAAAWFTQQLANPHGMVARRYLDERGMSDTTVRQFRLGYSPENRTALKHYMLGQGYSEQMLLRHGLIIQPDQGQSYDRFRNRLMFPITDLRGRVVAFGGRILGEGQPKYLNSPETPLFHKGALLYNAATARAAAHKEQRLIIAEGYMDVIALAQAGFLSAVAPLGTSVTEEHLRLCWNMTPEPLFCLDGDNAGQRAMQRVAELALPKLSPGKSLRFVILPAGEDPDSLIRQQGNAAFDAALKRAIPLSHWVWQQTAAQFGYGTDHFTPERKAAAEQKLEEVTEQIQDLKVRSHYKDYFYQQRQHFRPAKTSFKGKGAPRDANTGPSAPNTPLRKGADRLRQEKLLLALIISHPSLLEEDGNEEVIASLSFTHPPHQRLRDTLLHLLPEISESTRDGMMAALVRTGRQAEALSLLSDPVVALTAVTQPGTDPSLLRDAWKQCLDSFQENLLVHEDLSEDDWEMFVTRRLAQNE